MKMTTNIFNVKPVTTLVVLALLLAGCSTSTQTSTQGQTFTQGQRPGAAQVSATATPLPTRVVTAETSITADGQLTLTVPIIDIGFEQSGKVVSVTVSLGQTVKKGALLGIVDDTSLQDAVTDAELSLESLEASIAQSTAPATDAEIASAQAALNAAVASYNTTKAGSTDEEIATAKQGIDSAWRSYLLAQIQRDKACANEPGTTNSQLNTTGCKQGEASLGSAFESWVAAQDTYSKTVQPVAADTLAQSYASVVSAQAKLDSLKTGVSETQQKVYDEQISQAKATLQRAKDNLEKAKLYSPCDCIVNNVNVAVGVVAASDAFELINLSDMKFLTTNLVETNIEKVRVGAPVKIRMKAYTEELTGTVSTILQKSTDTLSNGVAVYTVLIDIPALGKTLLPGMTGQADISVQ